MVLFSNVVLFGNDEILLNKIIFSIDGKIYTSEDFHLWTIFKNYSQNNEPIIFNCSDLNDNKQQKKSTLDERIDEILILKDASKLGISNFVKKIEIQEKLNKFKERFNNTGSYNLFLECLGIDETKLFQIIGDSLIINKYEETRLKSQIEIYPVEIELYYKKNRESFLNNTLKESEPFIKPIIYDKKFEKVRIQLIDELKRNAKIIVNS